jgi:hypothetical protein
MEIKSKKLNHAWDNLLSPEQKEMIIKPGFGLSQVFPYLKAEDVKEIMNRIEPVIREIEEQIRERYQ